MDRSFAARSPAGRLGRTPGAASGGIASRWRPSPGAAGRGLRRGLRRIAARPRLRLALICTVVALPLLAGGWLWLRHSSYVAVQHVRIDGVHGPQARAIESALREAARGMSTLDAKPGALRAAVARFPVVSDVRAIPSFPHGMRILVTEQPPVAALLVAGVRTAVAGSGVVLGPALLSDSLPTVADNSEPAAGVRLRNPLVLDALIVLGAAPPALDRLASRAYMGPRGLTVAMRNGLLVYFGDATRPHAKWLSLARVLAEKSSAGATYIDVRLPGRPAAGFPEGGAPAEGESGAGEGRTSGTESTVSALAAGLTAGRSEPSGGGEEVEGTASGEASQTGTSGEAAEGSAAGTASPEASKGNRETGG